MIAKFYARWKPKSNVILDFINANDEECVSVSGSAAAHCGKALPFRELLKHFPEAEPQER
jgi:hypothetical protein